jgi:hypothetical protein
VPCRVDTNARASVGSTFSTLGFRLWVVCRLLCQSAIRICTPKHTSLIAASYSAHKSVLIMSSGPDEIAERSLTTPPGRIAVLAAAPSIPGLSIQRLLTHRMQAGAYGSHQFGVDPLAAPGLENNIIGVFQGPFSGRRIWRWTFCGRHAARRLRGNIRGC